MKPYDIEVQRLKALRHDKGLIEVTGLPAGARVITDGVLKVTDGMKVRLPQPGNQQPGGSGKP